VQLPHHRQSVDPISQLPGPVAGILPKIASLVSMGSGTRMSLNGRFIGIVFPDQRSLVFRQRGERHRGIFGAPVLLIDPVDQAPVPRRLAGRGVGRFSGRTIGARNAPKNVSFFLIFRKPEMAHLEGLEPPTRCLEGS
jgi:hypothetical protein